jgi:cell division protein FtsB
MDKLRSRMLDITRDFYRYATLNNVVLLVAVFIALGWVWGSVDALGRNYKYQQQVDDSRGQVELLDLQTHNLQAEKCYLQSDEYLQLAARAKLNKAQPGEKELILPQTTASTSGDSPGSSSTVPAPSNLEQWMQFLFGKH